MSKRDQELAHVAKVHGANYSLRIIREARRVDLPISLGFALIEQESRFQNVWGHDPPANGGTSTWGGRKVTKGDYLAYKGRRGATGKGGMQGVGPAQLTYYTLQDKADRYGGCWVARWNIRVAFEHLAGLIDKHGLRQGIRAYNGSGPAAEHYARVVLRRQQRWHDLFAKEAP